MTMDELPNPFLMFDQDDSAVEVDLHQFMDTLEEIVAEINDIPLFLVRGVV